MKIESINIIHSLVIWQSLLFAIVLLTPKYNKKKENKFLTAFLLVLGIHFIYNVLLSNNLYVEILPQYSCVYGFLYGPLLFLYIKSHLRKDFVLKAVDLFHFLPVAIIIVLTALGITICATAKFLLVPVMILYCSLGFLEVNNYKKVVLQVTSNITNSETNWIKTLLISMIVVLVLNLIQMQINKVSLLGLTIQLEHVVQLGVLILVNLIIYQGLKNPSFFQQISENDLDIIKENRSTDKSNILITELHKTLAVNLENYMKEEQPYLDSELSLSSLAQSIDTSPRTLSFVINHILDCPFSEYINSYRIKYAMELLENISDNQLSIKEIMYDVGFNSRSVFNTIFKKKTGLTPSQYRNNLPK